MPPFALLSSVSYRLSAFVSSVPTPEATYTSKSILVCHHSDLRRDPIMFVAAICMGS